MAQPLLWGLGAAALVWAQRAIRARRAARHFRARFAVSDDGVILGAAPRTYDAGGDRAVLLFHGYNDSPQSLEGVARVLHDAGWTVRLPLLPGHGRSLEAWDDWTAEELLAASREEFTAMRTRYRTLVVGGLSMGGAIACWLAAEADPDAVVLYAPMLFVPRSMQVAVSTARLWSLMTRYVSGRGGRSILDPEAVRRHIAYGCSSRQSLEALERIAHGTIARLGFVHQPVLVVQSEEDNRLPHDQSVHAIARIGSGDKTVVWTRGARHVVTMDFGWEALAARTADWLEARFPRRAAALPSSRAVG